MDHYEKPRRILPLESSAVVAVFIVFDVATEILIAKTGLRSEPQEP
jgi:hypothetical protein